MFAYCENNPVLRIDPQGEFFFAIIGAVVGAVCGAVEAAIKGEDILAGAAGGAVSGAITGAAADIIAVTGGTAVVAAGVMAGAGAIGALAENATKAAITGDGIDWKETGKDMFWGATFGGLFGYMGGNVASKLGKVGQKGLMTVLEEPLKGGIQKWASGLAEEFLSNATAEVGRFTANYIKTMFSNVFK